MDNSTPGMNEMLMRYLDGELTPGEREQLDRQMAEDSNLKKEYEKLVTAREAVKQYGLQKKVSGIHQQMMQEMQKPVAKISPVKRIIRYSMAAAAGVLFIVAGMMVYNYLTLSPEKIFVDNYRTYETVVLRDENNPESSLLQKAYTEKKYDEVAAMSLDRPFTTKEILLKGMAYLEIGNTEKAIDQYRLVIAQSSTAGLMKEEAEYYLLLAYIRSKQYAAALQLIESIRKQPGHLYYSKITSRLIRQVKSLNNR
jgi:tetratricopeptide (TPR) repeat protein